MAILHLHQQGIRLDWAVQVHTAVRAKLGADGQTDIGSVPAITLSSPIWLLQFRILPLTFNIY